MKIWLLSDLHLEYADLRQSLAIPDADVCVMAGDLCRAPANGVHWLATCQSARKVDPGSASNIDPLLGHDGKRPTGWSWSGLRSPVGRVG
jgi:hypothetical protein